MKRVKTICIGLVAATAQVVLADPFMNINFDADTAGTAPSVNSPSVYPITVPGAIGGYTATTSDIPPTAANGTILVNDIGDLTKAAVMTTNSANNVLGALWIDTGFTAVGQEISLSFDVLVADAPTSATVQPKTLNGSGTAGILLGMNTYSTGGWATRFAIAPTSETGGVFAIRSPDNLDLQSFFSYTEGESYNVKLVSNYDTGMVSTYVDNVFQSSKPFWNAGAANVSTSEFFFHLNGEADYANSVALDNIVASVVPEPSAIGLLGIGAIALLRRTRRS